MMVGWSSIVHIFFLSNLHLGPKSRKQMLCNRIVYIVTFK